MDTIRLAKPEEIEAIKQGSDIGPGCSVFAFGEGATADYAVFRMAPELDPVKFAPSTNDRRKHLFVWSLENGLRMTGTVPWYYFNVAANDAAWQHVVETNGAERVSSEPEFRYVKRLL